MAELEAPTFDPNVAENPKEASVIRGISGTVYRRAESLSFQRYGKMAELQLQMLYEKDAAGLFNVLKTIYKHLNAKDQLADAAVLCYNALKGVESIRDRAVDPFQKITMLFWNKEGENPVISDDELEEKCRDTEHLDAAFFLSQAAACIADFLNASKPASPSTSERKTTESGSST